jgi:phosphoadenosine phosphosulfate reductase
MTARTVLPELPITELQRRFETCTPQRILSWVLRDSGLGRVAIASSFQAEGTTVIHMATRIRPDVEVLFLDTGFHFAETLAFKRQLTRQLRLNVRDIRSPSAGDRQPDSTGSPLYERDPNACCAQNKVLPWQRALEDLDAWITSMRRDSSWTRRDAPIVSAQELHDGRQVLKVNPVANWTRQDVWRYLKRHRLPHHPLYGLGIPSIGCAPCTRAVVGGEDERAGRWSGTMKVECGIHVPAEHEPPNPP